ncbi:MAG TPA: WG repeat-containing protein [Flavobacteriales bacterium]|nr:WG repeat-containing protein [Flavobacteriales bacterium]
MKTKKMISMAMIIAFTGNGFGQDLIVYKNNSNLYGFVKLNTNDVIISPKYDYAYEFGSSGLALVKKDLKWGYK